MVVCKVNSPILYTFLPVLLRLAASAVFENSLSLLSLSGVPLCLLETRVTPRRSCRQHQEGAYSDMQTSYPPVLRLL
ncbi:hypothetical protein BJX70DRAFT_361028 [Aspergillus crustosus]